MGWQTDMEQKEIKIRKINAKMKKKQKTGKVKKVCCEEKKIDVKKERREDKKKERKQERKEGRKEKGGA